jgi:hypothetical protein
VHFGPSMARPNPLPAYPWVGYPWVKHGELAPHGTPVMPRPKLAMTGDEVVGGGGRGGRRLGHEGGAGWGTGSRAHQRGLTMATHVGRGEPPAIS